MAYVGVKECGSTKSIFLKTKTLKDTVLQELLRLPESRKADDISLQEILELAKRAEQGSGMSGSAASGSSSLTGPVFSLRARFKNASARRHGNGGNGGSGKFGKKKDAKFQVDRTRRYGCSMACF